VPLVGAFFAGVFAAVLTAAARFTDVRGGVVPVAGAPGLAPRRSPRSHCRSASNALMSSSRSALAARTARLLVYEPDGPLTVPSRWTPGLPPIPWRAWLEQGFGFLILLLVHMIGMNAVARLERLSGGPSRRFAAYRALIRGASLAAGAVLAVWLWRQRGG